MYGLCTISKGTIPSKVGGNVAILCPVYIILSGADYNKREREIW